MTTIKEWVNSGMSREATPENTYVTRRGYAKCHIVSFANPTIKEMKNRPGLIITFLVTRAIFNSDTEKFQCWTQYAKCLVFKTDFGMRAMWKVGAVGRPGKESTLWGFLPRTLTVKLGLNRYGYYEFREHVVKCMGNMFSTEEVIPMFKYIDHGIQNEWMYINVADHAAFTAGPGTKHALNYVYDRTGTKRIPKTAFGGVGEIRDWRSLKDALTMVRIFRNCDPHVFTNMPLIEYASDSQVQASRYILDFFRNTDKAVGLVLRELRATETRDFVGYWTTDTVRMLKRIRSIKVREAFRDALRRNPDMTMEDLHNMVQAEYQRQGTPNRRINSKELSKFDGAKISRDIKSVVPKQTHDLVTWGAEYNICIGSYADAVLRGETKCFGFQKPDGSFWGFAEVNNQNRLTQLLGKHNQPVPPQQRKQIVKWLKSHKVNCDNYWGKTENNY